jgi:transcriptional regulator GlxA family with amidase domain
MGRPYAASRPPGSGKKAIFCANLANMIGLDVMVLDGAGPTSVGVTVDVVDAANRIAAAGPDHRARPIDLRIVTAREDRTVRLRGGLSIDAVGIDRIRPQAWAVVAGLGAAGPTDLDDRLAQDDVLHAASWLREAHATGTRVAASCTGVFVAGAAGALDDRRCTTTWWLTGVLGRRHPRAIVEPDELVVSDGPLITAGAQFAAADLTLEVVAQSCGADLADAVASRLAIARRHSQAPFRRSEAYSDVDPTVAAAESFILANLDRPLRLAEIAAATHVSSRTLARRIEEAVGVSPIRFVRSIRVETALRLLRHGGSSLTSVAERVGAADAASLSRMIRQATGQPPSAFRTPPTGIRQARA